MHLGNERYLILGVASVKLHSSSIKAKTLLELHSLTCVTWVIYTTEKKLEICKLLSKQMRVSLP